MSTDTAEVQQATAVKPEAKATFSLDVSEQELLEEFGVLGNVEYGYGA